MKRQRLIIFTLIATLIMGGGSYGIIWAFSSAQGADSPFAVEKVSKLDDRIEIILTPKVQYAEIAVEPVLIVDSLQQSGKAKTEKDGRVSVVFTPPPSNVQGAVLELPAVSVEVQARTSQPANGDTILGPAGQRYQITKRAIDEARGVVEFYYQPTESDAPSVEEAVIRAGDKLVTSIGWTSTFDGSSGVFKDGVISFPIDAVALMESDAALLEVVLFRDMVMTRIPLP